MNKESLYLEFPTIQPYWIDGIYKGTDHDIELSRAIIREQLDIYLVDDTFSIQEFESNDMVFKRNCSFCCDISADLSMNDGYLTQFRRQFGELSNETGPLIVVEGNGCFIYYLVTRERYFNEPKLETIICCLNALKTHINTNNIQELSMPSIGCDKQIIIDMLKDSNLKKINLFHQ